MGLDNNMNTNHNAGAIRRHAFSYLSSTSPIVFLYLLKECYFYGTIQSTKRFRAFQHQLQGVFSDAPRPGPATFVAKCLRILPMIKLFFSDGLSHLVLSALRRFLQVGTTPDDFLNAKDMASQLFLDIVRRVVYHDESTVVKLVEIFDIRLVNIDIICEVEAKTNNASKHKAEMFVKQYISGLVKNESYMIAVTLLEQFSIQQYGTSFLHKMMRKKQFKAAEKWATFMGKSMLCVFVQDYMNLDLVKNAYEIINKNNLQQEYPDLYHKCKERSLKKLAEKGCWDAAEARTSSDRQLIEYLVYLAMEAGYSEKVNELCDRYSLEGFMKAKEPEASPLQGPYLSIKEFIVEDVIWVDEVNGLRIAANYFEGCKVIGFDCEWKPNSEQGRKRNKVAIIQIASEYMVFIFDLIKLYEEAANPLDDCLTRIFQTPRILKLGYNLRGDIKHLAHSYGTLGCFKHCQMLLDIQNVFNEPRGGLSGLAKKILGVGLNKTRRISNWEQRPLSQNQLEYAALDAVVLIHILSHARRYSQPNDVAKGHDNIEWKSHLVSHMGNFKKVTKGASKPKEIEATWMGKEMMGEFRPSHQASGGGRTLDIIDGKAYSVNGLYVVPRPSRYSKRNTPLPIFHRVSRKSISISSSPSSLAGKSWWNNPDTKRKRRIAKYKYYAVEGKVKASIKKGFRWFKDKCNNLL